MIRKSTSQISLFEPRTPIDFPLEGFVPKSSKWAILAERFSWDKVEKAFGKHYESGIGAPSVPIRRMVGLLLIAQIENLSDEKTVENWRGNAFWQFFCGELYLQNSVPCAASLLSVFRKRIGEEGARLIFALSVSLHGDKAEEKRVRVDTTVQPKNITYPTDSKLYFGIINRLHKLIQSEGIVPRRSYVRELKKLRLPLRFFGQPKKAKVAKKALRRLKTIAGALLRDVQRKLPVRLREELAEDFEFYQKALDQKRNDKNKIYSLHERDVSCVAKGKARQKYEYGSKCGIAQCAKSGVIVGATVHEGNPHDSKTLGATLESANSNRRTEVAEVVCDRGYKGAVQVNGATVLIPGATKYSGGYSERTLRKIFRSRAGIEPVIGHLKSDFKLNLCRLKGLTGDVFNLFMACSAWNFKLLVRGALRLFFVFLPKSAFFRLVFPFSSKFRPIPA